MLTKQIMKFSYVKKTGLSEQDYGVPILGGESESVEEGWNKLSI